MTRSHRTHPARTSIGGVTLIELLIAVTIVGILSAIAFPSYTRYVMRTDRTLAKSTLMQIADRQQQFFGDNKSYAADLTDLGYASDPFGLDDRGNVVAAASADRIYRITLTDTGALTFTANAVPQLRQAERDTGCGTLSVTHTGAKSQSGSQTDCWR